MTDFSTMTPGDFMDWLLAQTEPVSLISIKAAVPRPQLREAIIAVAQALVDCVGRWAVDVTLAPIGGDEWANVYTSTPVFRQFWQDNAALPITDRWTTWVAQNPETRE